MSENAASTEERTGLRLWAPLIAVCLAMFIVVVDSTMMNVAVPAIVRDLNTNVSAVQGVIALYSLVMASLMLTGSKLGAIKGVKRMFIVGIIIYGVGTLVAAVSWNIESLALGWSLLEGVGAALIVPLAYTLVIANYSGRRRAVSFGILSGVQASAAAVGPILGGLLTTFATWRLGFAGEVLIAILILPFTRYLVELVTADEETTLDWGGTVFSAVGLFSLVMGFLLAGRYGWFEAKRPFTIGDLPFNPLGLSPTPIFIGVGLILLVTFVHWQWRRERDGKTPLVRMRVLSNGPFLAGVSTNIVQSIIISGFLFVTPLFLQSALGYSAFESGLAILPFSAATFVVSLGTANLSARVSPKILIQIGVVLLGVGLFWFASVVNLQLSLVQMIVPGAIFGIGMGLLMAQLVNLTLSIVDSDDSPEASGVNNALDQLGNSLGTAVIGSLLLAFFLGGMVDGVARQSQVTLSDPQRQSLITELEDLREVVTADQAQAFFNSLPAAVQQTLTQLRDESMIESMQLTLAVLIGFVLVALLLSTFLPRKKPHEVAPEGRVDLGDTAPA